MKYYVGVDLGGTNIAVGLIDENYNFIEKLSIPTKSERGSDEIIADIAKTVELIINKAGINKADCVSLGVGSPGTIDETEGVVIYANNLRWNNVRLADTIEKLTGLKVFVSNDANCAALGEVLNGAAAGCKNAILLTLGTGVGGGIIIDGKIFSGGHPGGAELGHVLLSYEGEQCTCGRKGCLEAYASATALIRQTKRAMEANADSAMWQYVGGDINRVNGRVSFNVAKEGDRTAISVVNNYIACLAAGILDFINIFRPDIVIIGGGIANEGDNLLIPLNESVKRQAYAGEGAFSPPIVKATLGNNAGILGAAFLGS